MPFPYGGSCLRSWLGFALLPRTGELLWWEKTLGIIGSKRNLTLALTHGPENLVCAPLQPTRAHVPLLLCISANQGSFGFSFPNSYTFAGLAEASLNCSGRQETTRAALTPNNGEGTSTEISWSESAVFGFPFLSLQLLAFERVCFPRGGRGLDLPMALEGNAPMPETLSFTFHSDFFSALDLAAIVSFSHLSCVQTAVC